MARINAVSSSNDLNLTLDINSELFPILKGDTLSLQLTTSIKVDGSETRDEDGSGWRAVRSGDRTLADDYDYVMYGKIYRFDEGVQGSDKGYVLLGFYPALPTISFFSVTKIVAPSIFRMAGS